MNVLNEIVENTKKKIKNQRKIIYNPIPTQKNFAKSIQKKNNTIQIIAEFKRKSPSKGVIRKDASIEKIIGLYHKYASAISVLTEEDYFNGSILDLEKASTLTDKPILRKDFIIDPIQILEARERGADSYLLINKILSKEQIQELIDCGKQYKMSPLIEIYEIDELERVLSLDIEILGINSRNLETLSLSLDNFSKIMNKIPIDIKEKLIIVAESGIHTKEDVATIPQYTDAILVGTSIMKSDNPERTLKNIINI